MPVFRIYQQHLTDDQIAELNGPNGGWSAKPEFTAYADVEMGSIGITFGESSHKTVDDMVHSAIGLNIYQKVCDITADSLDHAFAIGNNGLDPMDDRITTYNTMTSIYVGNIVVDVTSDTWKAYLCDIRGWSPLDQSTLHTLLMNTAKISNQLAEV